MTVPTLLLILALALPTLAHFKLEWPPARGFDENTITTFPCGGQNTPSSNRTLVSPTGFPIHLLYSHDEAAVEVLIGLGNDPAPNFNVILVPTFREEGLGDFCIDNVTVAGVGRLNESSLNGQNATLQVITNGDSQPAGGLYNV